MTSETPIIFMQDPKTGENVYIQTHVEAVDGLPDDFEDYDLEGIQDNVSDLNNNLGGIQNQIYALQTQVNNMVKDTGWLNISLVGNITAYSTSETPKARLLSVNGVSFIALKGSVKGLTGATTIGTLPTAISGYLTDARTFVQNTTKVSNTNNFARWRVQVNGNIDMEGATQSTIDSAHWFSIGTTLML